MVAPAYVEKLSTEVAFIGISTILMTKLVAKIFPRANSNVQLFLSGALIHLGCEVFGLNEWYLHHSAAEEAFEEEVCDRKPLVYLENKCHFVKWESQSLLSSPDSAFIGGLALIDLKR